ncbi:MAG: chorismate-binding protein [Flavobacteriaceae bacterium]|nr:chorismate-binding protein [Flavobacteriaceae bacterium]
MKITSELLFNKIEKSIENNKPCVCYRAPKRSELRAFFQNDRRVYKSKRLKESGFIFAPFDFAQQNAIIIPENKSEFNSARFSARPIELGNFEDQNNTTLPLEKRTYKKLIDHCKRHIELTEIKKIVLSRRIAIETDPKDYLQTFQNLLNSRTNAMVYIWFHPKVGLWIGATPETLLRVNGSSFETMSLAGTKAFDNKKKIEWTYKERREQNYVTRFILEQISKKVNFVKTSRTRTVIAGNVAHRCTTIKGILGSKTTLFSLVSYLHPTPAVCGLPQKSAKEFILANEGYDRKYYTGFLGEVNFMGISNLFVNLRCIELKNNVSYIYVGGGITIESNSEDEWIETVEKSKVIKKALAVR